MLYNSAFKGPNLLSNTYFDKFLFTFLPSRLYAVCWSVLSSTCSTCCVESSYIVRTTFQDRNGTDRVMPQGLLGILHSQPSSEHIVSSNAQT